MAVVRNLMVRIGADYSAAVKGMQGASRSMKKFKNEAEDTTKQISGDRGLGGASKTVRRLGRDVEDTTTKATGSRGLRGLTKGFAETGRGVADSISRIRGANGIGSLVTELGALKGASGAASNGLSALGVTAITTGSRFGVAGAAIAATVATLGIAVKLLHDAAQPAVKYESTLGRLNMALKDGADDYLEWTRSMKLSKTAAAEMGATYGVLLSSFIKDTGKLQTSTQELVQATRVVASATGRSIEDTLERMRSGLLGNTEAIEDLGVFVNVSMIESTNAFKKFANGKSWEQLDFQLQQQIRLAAILEQSYARYGNTLQNNVMSKQSNLTDGLKDLKLHLSQIALPIWEAVLPALTALVNGISNVAEHVARFTHWVLGKEYEGVASTINDQAKATDNLSGGLKDTADAAKAAKKELAGFDRLNLLGSPSGGGSGKGGAGGSLPGLPKPPASGGGAGGFPDLPTIPPALAKPWKITFDPPTPPDAGAGAVATNVTATINTLIADSRAKMSDLWSNLQTQTQLGLQAQGSLWTGYSGQMLGTILPTLVNGTQLQWSNMWANLGIRTQTGSITLQSLVANMGLALGLSLTGTSLNLQTTWNNLWNNLQIRAQTGSANVQTGFNGMLGAMLVALTAKRPLLETQWSLLMTKLESIKNPLTNVRTEWHNTLDYMQSQLNAYRPYLEVGLGLIGAAVSSPIPALDSLKNKWNETLQSMHGSVATYISPIISMIDATRKAWNDLKSALTGGGKSSASTATSGGYGVSDFIAGAKGIFSKDTLAGIAGLIQSEAAKPENQAGAAVVGTLAPAGKLGQVGIKWLDDIIKLFSSGGMKGIPAFASGGVVSSPTLAMVGDNPNARANPEIIAPQDMMFQTVQAAMAAGNAEIVQLLERVARATESGRSVQVTIAESEVGQAATNHINRQYRRGVNVLDSVT